MSGTPNESSIYGYLINNLHLTKAGAAGVLGNFEVESGFSPTSVNAREGAIGLPNWEGSRRTKLQRYAAAHGGKETDLAMQLGYLGQELGGSYSRVLGFLRKTNDPAAAAAYFDVGPGGRNSGTGFENSSGDATGLRQADAQTIYQQIQAGKLTPTKAPPGSLQVAGGGILNDVTGGIAGTTGDVIGAGGAVIDALNPFSGIMADVYRIVAKGVFTIGGLGLVVLGLYAASQPARDKAQAKAAPIAEAAAAA